ncbi:MAG: hypothetical protein SVR08_11905 [Spirochaetota bacterium]|nr:hypothetical protein [Thermodesulfobacteriota bacterium]MDY6969339.1 hypothetical protein [Spirochaetota bacterium]
MNLIRTKQVLENLPNITKTTLYAWEKKGIIVPVARTPGGHKIWDMKDVEKLVRNMVKGWGKRNDY